MIVQIQKKILLVDDNPFDQLELKKLFTSNIRIDSTYGGEEAIELVRNEESQYGLIIIKSFLPGLDSFDVIKFTIFYSFIDYSTNIRNQHAQIWRSGQYNRNY